MINYRLGVASRTSTVTIPLLNNLNVTSWEMPDYAYDHASFLPDTIFPPCVIDDINRSLLIDNYPPIDPRSIKVLFDDASTIRLCDMTRQRLNEDSVVFKATSGIVHWSIRQPRIVVDEISGTSTLKVYLDDACVHPSGFGPPGDDDDVCGPGPCEYAF